jgi:hypothetical protein
MFAWSSWHTITPLATGIVGLALWLLHEQLLAKQPMISLEMLMSRTAGPSYLGQLFLGLIQFAILYYLPLYFEASLIFQRNVGAC